MRVRVAGLVLACAGLPAAGADLSPIEPGLDYHSFANADQFRTTHIALNLRIDLEGKVISGVVELELKRLDPRATQLVLDTKDLMISDVTQKSADVLGATAKNQIIWVSRPFRLEKPDPILGSALVIDLPPSRNPVAKRFYTPSRSRSARVPGFRCRTRRWCEPPTKRGFIPTPT